MFRERLTSSSPAAGTWLLQTSTQRTYAAIDNETGARRLLNDMCKTMLQGEMKGMPDVLKVGQRKASPELVQSLYCGLEVYLRRSTSRPLGLVESAGAEIMRSCRNS